VFDTLTVTENLEMGGYLLTKPQLAARIDTVMSTFPTLANMRSRTASKLSGGERKMLAVARVLMVEPTVLVLDEPNSNLSPELSRSVLQDQVRRLADSGTAVLLVEQKAFEALGVSDRAYILVAGRVEIAGAASEILGRPDIREVFLGQSGTRFPGRAALPWTGRARRQYPNASNFGSRAMTETGDQGDPAPITQTKPATNPPPRCGSP
jgi:ABC-type branched-subunit amino acid transport system ATPase component